MRLGTVCSGIGGAELAFAGLVEHAFAAEIAPFPRAVLAHRFPDVPLRGDFTEIRARDHGSIDVLAGGTPCQSFSVAGLRGGMADQRGNLALEYLRLAARLRPRWLFWENVPGILSSNGGRDFAAFLGGLAQLGYGFAYRVFNAEYFGLAQRRNRVFLVGYLGDWRRAAAVLFEPHSLQGHPAPRREARENPAAKAAFGVAIRGREGGTTAEIGGQTAHALRASSGGGDKPHVLIPDVARCLTHGSGGGQRYDAETETLIAGTMTSNGDGHTGFRNGDGLVAFDRQFVASPGNRTRCAPDLPASTLLADSALCVAATASVRRLTPLECERLQGFPDGWTLIPWRKGFAADGPRYKALGNAWAVPNARWIACRMVQIDALKPPRRNTAKTQWRNAVNAALRTCAKVSPTQEDRQCTLI